MIHVSSASAFSSEKVFCSPSKLRLDWGDWSASEVEGGESRFVLAIELIGDEVVGSGKGFDRDWAVDAVG